MSTVSSDPLTLGLTLISMGIALEEALKALAEKNGNQPGPWLDEVQELALLRAKAHLAEYASDKQAAALGAVDLIFTRMKGAFSGIVVE
jgi:membrane-bound lytic murein transglycosylase MltF